jgi:hypothetical protein
MRPCGKQFLFKPIQNDGICREFFIRTCSKYFHFFPEKEKKKRTTTTEMNILKRAKTEDQGCQIFLGQTYQNGKIYQMTTNYTKRPYGCKMFQIVIKYTNIFHSKALQNLPKLRFLV